MRNNLTFDGVSCQDMGLYVGFAGTEDAPKRSIESIDVPGRNGALTIDNGRFDNIEVRYQCVIRDRFEQNIRAARSFFLSRVGYCRLEDSAHPDYYRMARYVSGMDVTPSQMRQQGSLTLIFDCMPQRFLKSGEDAIIFTRSGGIYNDGDFASRPLIRVYGNGALGVGSETITIASNPGYIDIDSEMMDAHMGATNCNDKITLSSGEFPVLEPGDNGITLGSGITRVVITPRWWTV